MSRIPTPLAQVRQLEKAAEKRIPPGYLDENQHVNVQYYMRLFERGLMAFFDGVGLGAVYTAADVYGNFALEQHIRYFDEILVDETVGIYIRLVALGVKRAYIMGFLVNESREELAAIVEIVMMNVDMAARRGAPFPPDAKRRLDALLARQQALPWAAPVCGVMRI